MTCVLLPHSAVGIRKYLVIVSFRSLVLCAYLLVALAVENRRVGMAACSANSTEASVAHWQISLQSLLEYHLALNVLVDWIQNHGFSREKVVQRGRRMIHRGSCVEHYANAFEPGCSQSLVGITTLVIKMHNILLNVQRSVLEL